MKVKRRQIFFTSDQHRGHANAIKHNKRPYESVEEMDEDLILRWNKQAKPNDIIYDLGDSFWNTMPKKRIREIIKRLNGEIHLVIGNHDKLTVQQALRLGFKSACYEMVLKIGGEYVRISHYPYGYSLKRELKLFFRNPWKWLTGPKLKHKDKRPRDNGGWLVHGHDHRKNAVRGKEINVGVDAWDYNLVSIDKIAEIIKKGKK